VMTDRCGGQSFRDEGCWGSVGRRPVLEEEVGVRLPANGGGREDTSLSLGT